MMTNIMSTMMIMTTATVYPISSMRMMRLKIVFILMMPTSMIMPTTMAMKKVKRKCVISMWIVRFDCDIDQCDDDTCDYPSSNNLTLVMARLTITTRVVSLDGDEEDMVDGD